MDWSNVLFVALGVLGGSLSLTSPQVRAVGVALFNYAKSFVTKKPATVELTATVESTSGDYRKTLAGYAIDIADAIGAENVPVSMLEKLLALDKPKSVQLDPQGAAGPRRDYEPASGY